MAFKDLFKSKAERRAYAKGRKDQYNKEHPRLKWGIQTTTYIFDKDGSLWNTDTDIYSEDKYSSKKDASRALNNQVNEEKYRKEKVLKSVKKKDVNVHSAHDCAYRDYKLVRINERKE